MTTATTFNRSQITKSAWTLVKTQGLSFSEAMKQAWAEAKLPCRNIISVKSWKSDKGEVRIYITFSDNKQGTYFLSGSKYNAKGSTEGMNKKEFDLAKSIAKSNGYWTNVYCNNKPNIKNVLGLDSEEYLDYVAYQRRK
jgi:hypothetical protein